MTFVNYPVMATSYVIIAEAHVRIVEYYLKCYNKSEAEKHC